MGKEEESPGQKSSNRAMMIDMSGNISLVNLKKSSQNPPWNQYCKSCLCDISTNGCSCTVIMLRENEDKESTPKSRENFYKKQDSSVSTQSSSDDPDSPLSQKVYDTKRYESERIEVVRIKKNERDYDLERGTMRPIEEMEEKDRRREKEKLMTRRNPSCCLLVIIVFFLIILVAAIVLAPLLPYFKDVFTDKKS